MSESQKPIIPAESATWLASVAEMALRVTVTFDLSDITLITPTLRSGGESRPANLHFFEGYGLARGPHVKKNDSKFSV